MLPKKTTVSYCTLPRRLNERRLESRLERELFTTIIGCAKAPIGQILRRAARSRLRAFLGACESFRARPNRTRGRNYQGQCKHFAPCRAILYVLLDSRERLSEIDLRSSRPATRGAAKTEILPLRLLNRREKLLVAALLGPVKKFLA